MNEDFVIKDDILIKYKGNGGDVVIPDGVKIIGSMAFEGCSNLTSVVIPDSVTEIKWRAFKGCSSLTSIKIPDSVEKIGDCVFEYCTSLTSAIIGNSVKAIEWWVFRGCINLESVIIGNSVTSIGDSTFCGCYKLTSVVIPDSVTEVDINAFEGTSVKRKPQGNKAYKGFRSDMTCRRFQYEEGKTYVCDNAELCRCGFHACTNPLDCFGYYYGKDVVYHEVILDDRSLEVNYEDSKVCGRKITIGRRLTIKEMVEAFNELNKI